MDVHQMNPFMALSRFHDDAIVLSVDSQAFRPRWQSGPLNVSQAVGWIVNVGEKDVTTTGEGILDLHQHGFEAI